MADVAVMDIVLGAKVDGAVNGLTLVEKTLLEISAVSQKMAASLDVISRTLTTVGTVAVKTDSSLDTVSKGLNEVGNSAVKAGTDVITTTTRMVSGFTAVETSIDKIAADFHAKWNPIIAEAEAAAGAVTQTNQSFVQLKNTFANFPKFTPFQQIPTAPLKNIKPAASQATQALTDLGRVAQDLPFGFIAIQNNLVPLAESLGRLRAEAAASGTTLTKSLLGALSGPGGIGIALSAVSAAITLMTVGFGAWTRGFSSGAKAVDEAKKANEDYVKSIKDIDKSVVESSQKQIVQLEILSKVAQDTGTAMNVRLDATKKLQELSPTVLGSLSKEQILYGDLTEAIKETTEALINQALAQAETDKAVKAGANLFTIIEKRKIAQVEHNAALADFKKIQGTIQPREVFEFAEKQVRDTAAALDILNTQFFEADLELATFKGHAENFTKLGAGATNVEKIMSKLKESIDELNKKAQATGASFKDEKISAYKSALDSLINAGLAPTDAKVKELVANVRSLGSSFDENKKHIKSAFDVIKDLNKELDFFKEKQEKIGGEDFRKQMVGAIAAARDELIKLGKAGDSPEVQALVKLGLDIEKTMIIAGAAIQSTLEKIDLSKIKDISPDRLTRGPSLTVSTPAFKEATRGMQFLSDNLEAVKKVTQDIQGIFEQTFEAMAKGGSNAIKTLFSLFEQLLIKMVATAAAAALLAVILNSITLGGSSLGSLMELGKSFKGIFKSLLHFQHGGIVTGPTRALIGEAGPEVVFPLDRLREFIQPAQSQVVVLETRVRGNDLWLSQSRTGQRRGRTY